MGKGRLYAWRAAMLVLVFALAVALSACTNDAMADDGMNMYSLSTTVEKEQPELTDDRLLQWRIADAPSYEYIPVMGGG